MIRIDVRNLNVTVGGRVAGQVTWNAEGTKRPRKIEVALRRRFEGKIKKEYVVAEIADGDTETRSPIVVPFDFKVPMNELPTYQGKLVTVIWEIFTNVDLPWAVDEHDAKVITVGPAVWTAEEYANHHEDLDDEGMEEDEDSITESST